MQKSLQSYQELTLLEQERSQSRQASFLKIFLSGFIMLHFVGLLIMICLPTPSRQQFAIVGLQLSLYIAALFFNTRCSRFQFYGSISC